MVDGRVEGRRFDFSKPGPARDKYLAEVEKMRIKIDEDIEVRDEGRREARILSKRFVCNPETGRYEIPAGSINL